ncbi:hypothetical protein PA25_22160 [Pseudoalteromonas sp. A25]|uniref:PQQ-binding-like beta-propeller repeat protein n=1 Tax=Pseudoalteromonas sp. A25 TaxID=116092 RepID=UPI0012A26767|nr:PQQ-binding-like beta-propeller repeat protein [Pseudoalteromonas sp. A25]BBN82231.1 hypothetical protein PA25_22160 [Pseudoalteromonas sp. A25]
MKTTKKLKHLTAALALSSCLMNIGFAASGDYLYSFNVGAENWGSVSYKDHTAYFGSDDGKLYALNVEQPYLKWTYSTQGIVRSKPAISNHQLFFSSDDGYLYALNRWSGTLLWKANLDDADIPRYLPANHAPWEFDYAKSSPIVNGAHVYVGSANGKLYALSAYSGQVLWTFDTKGKIRSTPIIKDNLLYISNFNGTTYAINRFTADQVWSHQSSGAITSHPEIVDDALVIGSRDTKLYALDLITGKEHWHLQYPEASWVDSSASADPNGKYFYIGSSDLNMLYKINIENGDIEWQFNTGGWAWGKPQVSKGVVYMGSVGHDEPNWYDTKRGFYAVDTQTGKLKWQYNPEKINQFVHGGVHGTPAIGYGKVIVPDLDGYIHVYEQ